MKISLFEVECEDLMVKYVVWSSTQHDPDAVRKIVSNSGGLLGRDDKSMCLGWEGLLRAMGEILSSHDLHLVHVHRIRFDGDNRIAPAGATTPYIEVNE